MLTDHSDAMAACRALVLRYHRDIDRGCATAGIDVFAENAEFAARGQVMRGRGEILGFLSDRERQTDRHTVHVIANEVVVAADDDHVELDAFVLLHVRQADSGYHLDRVFETRHTFPPGMGAPGSSPGARPSLCTPPEIARITIQPSS